MSEKRKDSKGRVLKDGESQRANGTYDYRYTDIHKKRRCIYAKSLTELRKKEEELWRDLADGIDYAAGEMTVADLVDRYMNLKRGLNPIHFGRTTQRSSGFMLTLSGKKPSKR